MNREVYEFRFYDPIANCFGFLSIAAYSEWKALMAFNQIPNLVHKGQRLIKFI